MSFPFTLPDTLGWAGMIIFLVSYALMSLKVIKSDGYLYQGTTFLGAVFVGAQMYLLWNIPILIMEAIIGLVALTALLRSNAAEKSIQIPEAAFWHLFYCILVETCRHDNKFEIELWGSDIIMLNYDGIACDSFTLHRDRIVGDSGVITFAELSGAHEQVRVKFQHMTRHLRPKTEPSTTNCS